MRIRLLLTLGLVAGAAVGCGTESSPVAQGVDPEARLQVSAESAAKAVGADVQSGSPVAAKGSGAEGGPGSLAPTTAAGGPVAAAVDAAVGSPEPAARPADQESSASEYAQAGAIDVPDAPEDESLASKGDPISAGSDHRPRTTGPDMSWFAERDIEPSLRVASGRGSCHLVIHPSDSGDTAEYVVRLDVPPIRCANLSLALRYNTRTDFVRLLDYLEIDRLPTLKYEWSAVSDPTRRLTIEGGDRATMQRMRRMQVMLSSDTCQVFEFFGVELVCFNGIEGAKEDNLRYVIPYVTIAVYSSSMAHRNLMLGSVSGGDAMVTAYSVLAENQARLFDGTNQPVLCASYKDTLLARDIGDSVCQPGTGTPEDAGCYPAPDGSWVAPLNICGQKHAQAHSFGSAKDAEHVGSFFCSAVLGGYVDDHPPTDSRSDFARDFWYSKFEYSSMLYHETLHAFGQLTSNFHEFGTLSHLLPCPSGMLGDGSYEYPNCSATPKPPECQTKADWDWLSIHGSQISLLLSMTLNPTLNCDERQEVFKRAAWRTENRLCQLPPKSFEAPYPQCGDGLRSSVSPSKTAHDPAPVQPQRVAGAYEGCQTGF